MSSCKDEVWKILIRLRCQLFDMSIVEDSFNLEAHFIDSNGKMGFGFFAATKSLSTLHGTTKEKEVLRNTLFYATSSPLWAKKFT